MATIDTAMVAVHLIFGAIWVGSVTFTTFVILPLARDGDLDRPPLETSLSRLQLISRIGALAMVISGLHLMGTGSYFDTAVLLETNRGRAIVAMIVLWFLFITILEISTRRIKSGLGANLLREPARDGLSWFYVATTIGLLLYVIGAMITTGFF